MIDKYTILRFVMRILLILILLVYSHAIELQKPSTYEKHQDIIGWYMSEKLESYILHLIELTRSRRTFHLQSSGPPSSPGQQNRWILYGASPRGAIALDRCSRAHAWLKGRDFVTPEDIQTMARDVLRHRVLLTFEAEAEGISPDMVIDSLLEQVPVP